MSWYRVLCVLSSAVLISADRFPISGEICSTNIFCDRCVDDIHHMSGTVQYRIDGFDRYIDMTRTLAYSGLNRLNGSISALSSQAESHKRIVLNKLQVHSETVSRQLTALRAAIMAVNKEKEHAAIVAILEDIKKMQGDLHLSVTDLGKYLAKILSLAVSGREKIESHLNQISNGVNGVGAFLRKLLNSLDGFKKMDDAIAILNKVNAVIQDISQDVSGLKASLGNLFGLSQNIKSYIETIKANNLLFYKDMQALIQNVQYQHKDIITKVNANIELLLSMSELIKQIDININRVNAELIRVKEALVSLKDFIVKINNDLTSMASSVEGFSQLAVKILQNLGVLKEKSSNSYSLYLSFKEKLIKSWSVTKAALQVELSRIGVLIQESDQIIALQNNHINWFKAVAVKLKATITDISNTEINNHKSFLDSTKRAKSLGNTMSVAISIFQQLGKCKCHSGFRSGPCDKVCPGEAIPVCASDGRTYTNICEMKMAACRANTRFSYTRGVCASKPFLPKPRPPPTEAPKPRCRECSKSALEVCGSDGKTYTSACAIERINCLIGTSVKLAYEGPCKVITTSRPSICGTCTNIKNILCGSDGRTYASFCHMNRQNCLHKKSVSVVKFGPCSRPPTPNRCALIICTSLYRPVCGTDGVTYDNVCLLKRRACYTADPKLFAHKGLCRQPCMKVCTLNIKYVCGSDGVTYSNECALKNAACTKNIHIVALYNGKCLKKCVRYCRAAYAPVCGSDGVTYDSLCNLRNARCANNKRVTVAYIGRCSGPKPCSVYCRSSYAFVCGSDGITYNSLCHLKKAACLKNNMIVVLYRGKCLKKPCLTACTKIYKPVCGSNGVTYTNECHMKNAGCYKGITIVVKFRRPCSHNCLRYCPSSYIPVCGSDGFTYDNLCKLQKAACLQSRTITVYRSGVCKQTLCTTLCPPQFSPVCGRNQKTYDNKCLYLNAACYGKFPGLCTPGYCDVPCPTGFIKVKGITGCFYFRDPVKTTSQDAAQRDCTYRGAELIMFRDDAEYAAMRKYVATRTKPGQKRNYWTAGRETGPGYTTRWVWCYKKYVMNLKSAWHENRPQRQGACAAMYGLANFALADVSCTKYPFSGKYQLNDTYGWICRK